MSLERINGRGCRRAEGLGVTLPQAPAAGRHRARGTRRTGAVGLGLAAGAVAGVLLTTGWSPATAATPAGHIQSAIQAANTKPPVAPTVVRTTARHTTREQTLARLVNSDRTKRGLKAYAVSASLSAIAEDQAHRMSRQQTLFHNPNLTTEVHHWQAVGENVAYTSTVSRAHTLLMNSPSHRANILNKTFTQVGLGVAKDSHGTVWVVEVFRKPA